MKKYLTFVLTGLVLLMGCGDDGGVTAPETTAVMTQSQAEAVSDNVGVGTESAFDTGTSTKIIARLQQSGSGTINTTATCAGGGDIDLSGTLSATGSSSNISATYNITETYNDCKVISGSDEIILNGTLTNSGTLSGNQNSVTLNATLLGSLDVTGDIEEAGTCGIGAAISVSVTQSGGTVNVNGSACGYTLNESEVIDI